MGYVGDVAAYQYASDETPKHGVEQLAAFLKIGEEGAWGEFWVVTCIQAIYWQSPQLSCEKSAQALR